MEGGMWREIVLLVVLLCCVKAAPVLTHQLDYQLPNTESDILDEFGVYGTSDEKYVRHVYSMVDAYQSTDGGQGAAGGMVIESNALINTKYRTWKRNADLINSLLALPKGMNDAGR